MENNELYNAIDEAVHIKESLEYYKAAIAILEDKSLSFEQMKAQLKAEKEKYELRCNTPEDT